MSDIPKASASLILNSTFCCAPAFQPKVDDHEFVFFKLNPWGCAIFSLEHLI